MSGLMRASYKRPVSCQMLETIVDNIEQTLLSDYEREVTSVKIGGACHGIAQGGRSGVCSVCLSLPPI